ncbi:MAG: hypothetical protein HKN76_11015 [Saprospiraceae bacterium]|nr:hypothetical protein [Saprospiraceae bacterium]
MLHILNGDAVLEVFKESNLQGDYAVWRELFCQGPTTLRIDSEESMKLRLDFLEDFLGETAINYFNKWESQLQKIVTTDLQKVTVWFEYDLFCQINMMAAINLITSLNESAEIFLINVGNALDQKDWITLGHLDSGAWGKLYKDKRLLSPQDISWMKEAWQIYNSSDHRHFDRLVDSCPVVYKYFPAAIENHYRRFPSKVDKLTDIQRFIINKLQPNSCLPRVRILRDLMKHFHYYGYGDQQLMAMIKALFFIEVRGKDYCLLSEKINREFPLADLPDMTYGGMHNKSQYLEDFIEV